MAYKTYARMSATMPQGITLERARERLHALAVLCHGWRSPARQPLILPAPIGRLVLP